MQLKVNLHTHTSEDPLHGSEIKYGAREAIDEAVRLGFGALALTLHDKCGTTPELIEYARAKGVLLIPGIEKTIERRHVLILSPDPSAERVETFADLTKYRASHPESFIIAPHPYFYGWFSLKEKFDRHHELFDAVEQSWFYTPLLNRNRRGERASKQYQLPFIATSDIHMLKYLNNSYALVEADEKSVPAIFSGLRARRFKNVSKPALFLDDMVIGFGGYVLRYDIPRMFRKLFTKTNGSIEVVKDF